MGYLKELKWVEALRKLIVAWCLGIVGMSPVGKTSCPLYLDIFIYISYMEILNNSFEKVN